MLLADRVALLADGVIAVVGTHSELLATEPRYRELMSGADRARRERATSAAMHAGASDLARRRRRAREEISAQAGAPCCAAGPGGCSAACFGRSAAVVTRCC